MAKKDEEVTVTIAPNGEVRGDVVKGPGGVGCLDLLEELLGDLGPQKAVEKKDAFYQQLNDGTKTGIKVGGK